MSESALVSKQLEIKLKMVLKQKEDNNNEFKKFWDEVREREEREEREKRETSGSMREGIESDKVYPTKDQIKKKDDEFRLEAEIINLEIQILKKKIAEARINEL